MDWKIPFIFMEVLLCIAVTRMSSYYWLSTSNWSVQRVRDAFAGIFQCSYDSGAVLMNI